MEIREAQLSDLPLVLALYDEFDRVKSIPPTVAQQGNIFESLLQTGGCVLIALEAEFIVGTCTLNICPNFSWSGRSYAIIENVIVTKDFQNEGIGKALLARASKLAENKGCYKVALMTGSKEPSTLQFYESAGFSGSKQGFQRRFNS